MPMRHATEDDLTLHYYGELTGRDAAELERHLADCAACRESYARLERVMHAIDALPDPELPPAYEREVWARLRPGLRAARDTRFPSSLEASADRRSLGGGGQPRPRWTGFAWPFPHWALAGSLAALLVVAFVGGTLWRHGAIGGAPDATATVAVEDSDRDMRERLLLAAVGDHLERTELVLIELLNARADGGTNISGERARAEELVAANRLYRQTAADVGDQTVAALLDQVERILTEVAVGPSEPSAADLDSMRRRIEGQNILFNVQVISSELRERERVSRARRSRMIS
jgi:anti-sigma factor RsiW